MSGGFTGNPGDEPSVDVHAHALLPRIEAMVAGSPALDRRRQVELRCQGQESAEVSVRMVRERIPSLVDAEVRLADMARTGIDVQLVSVTPAQFHYWAGPDQAMDLSQAVNEGIAAHCAQRPGQLAGLGVVPLQHPELAVAALEHAVRDCGLKGVEISTYAPDPTGDGLIELSDPRLEPLWQRAQELEALIFLHPFGCELGTRLDRWNLANTIGQPLEHAIALSHLIFAGVLDRHPALRLLAAHGGGYLPAYLGRGDHAWRVRPDAATCERPPSSYPRDVHVDSLVHSPTQLRSLVDQLGSDRVLLGTDHPFDMGEPDPLGQLKAAALSPEQQRDVASGNARRLNLLPTPASPPRKEHDRA
ncbi:amidohydrolase family protein [Streptomyces sp. NPDC102274]|uniref:amidohydrolase family protein n=1 Tax=Streptomyces sp. NPDC102274 TaxID=3366151 RepID=UPI0037F4D481